MSDPTRVRCQTCDRSQKWLGEVSLRYIGWAQIEEGTGWLCPFHSDAGPANLMKILEKTK